MGMYRCSECNMDYDLAVFSGAFWEAFVCPNCKQNNLLQTQNESIEKQNRLIESQLERSKHSSRWTDSDIESFSQKVANEKVAGVLSIINNQLAQENERRKEEETKFDTILKKVRAMPREAQLEVFLYLINEDKDLK